MRGCQAEVWRKNILAERAVMCQSLEVVVSSAMRVPTQVGQVLGLAGGRARWGAVREPQATGENRRRGGSWVLRPRGGGHSWDGRRG